MTFVVLRNLSKCCIASSMLLGIVNLPPLLEMM
jgi:hypothetical protein